MFAAFNFGILSYTLVGLSFLLLCGMLLTRWRGRLDSPLLILCCLISAVWALTAAYAAQSEHPISLGVILVELCRDLVWAIFLVRLITLLNPDSQKIPSFVLTKKLAYGVPVFFIFLLVTLVIIFQLFSLTIPLVGYEFRIIGQVLIAIIGLSLVEQVFRNVESEHRWTFKFFCFGVGAFYLFDFYLYSDALLFSQMDHVLWFARPWVYLIAIVLIFIAISRNPVLRSNVNVSRAAVFYTTAIVLTGLYLLILSAGGFYLQQFGGSWAKIASISFLFSGILFLLMLVFSSDARARFRVFVDEHFLDYKYDYREQWLGLMQALSTDNQEKNMELRALHAMTKIMDSGGGALWVKQAQQYRVTAQVGMPGIQKVQEEADGSLVTYLESSQWVINLFEYGSTPGLYVGLVLPDWLRAQEKIWLIVPLMLQSSLYGFVAILQPRAEKTFNWEDIALLKAAGRQVAIHLAQQRAAVALAEARQFEAFNRFSAYVVHDLKNLVSQLALVVKNAEKHKHNPAFMDDAISTVDNAVDRMNRLLAQLRAGTVEKAVLCPVDVCELLHRVIEDKSHSLPVPVLHCSASKMFVQADASRFISVMGHIVQNAQDATGDDGEVLMTLSGDEKMIRISVRDTGCGMEQKFIDERLFEPFYTTKGLTGMGIGAHEYRAFVEELRGTLSIESEVGQGTEIIIILPLA